MIPIPADRRTLVGQKPCQKNLALEKGFNRVMLIEAEKSESNLSITKHRRGIETTALAWYLSFSFPEEMDSPDES